MNIEEEDGDRPLGNRRQLVNRDREVAKLRASNWVRSTGFSHLFLISKLTVLQSFLACERKRLITFLPLLSILPQVWNFAGGAIITNMGTMPLLQLVHQ